jgi:predicted nuclease of predicted toxin-antitoxin system
MKLLLDTCVWGDAVPKLREAGHDVVWTGQWQADPGDQAILRYAYEKRRVLVTLDKDFGERAIVFGEPHNGIMRLVGISARQQAEYCLSVLTKYGADLARGAIVTVDTRRTRIRLPDNN